MVNVSEFISAIKTKKVILVRFLSKEDGRIIERICYPMDYGPSRKAKEKNDRFHIWDQGSDEKPHTLSLNPEQIVEIVILNDNFDPSSFIKWDTKKSPWFIERDWGEVS
jgi:hypothetical protein